ncbi:MAG TPA: hypothetical protein DCW31_01655 [Lactobacillus sp.]|nr:hypothetical protein [Lactobacillus sp.]
MSNNDDVFKSVEVDATAALNGITGTPSNLLHDDEQDGQPAQLWNLFASPDTNTKGHQLASDYTHKVVVGSQLGDEYHTALLMPTPMLDSSLNWLTARNGDRFPIVDAYQSAQFDKNSNLFLTATKKQFGKADSGYVIRLNAYLVKYLMSMGNQNLLRESQYYHYLADKTYTIIKSQWNRLPTTVKYQQNVVEHIETVMGITDVPNHMTKLAITPLDEALKQGNIIFSHFDADFGHGQGMAYDKKHNQILVLQVGDVANHIVGYSPDNLSIINDYSLNDLAIKFSESAQMACDDNGSIYIHNGVTKGHVTERTLYQLHIVNDKLTLQVMPIVFSNLFVDKNGHDTTNIQCLSYNNQEGRLYVLGDSAWFSFDLADYLSLSQRLETGKIHNVEIDDLHPEINRLEGTDETEALFNNGVTKYILGVAPNAIMTNNVMYGESLKEYEGVKH